MNTVPEKVFFGKTLLFGEYVIMHGGQALTTPFRKLSGSFDRYSDQVPADERGPAISLKQFAEWLKDRNSSLPYPLQIERLLNDLDSGLFFNSSIPNGYGAGSSGALVAAVFYCYTEKGKEPILASNPESIEAVRLQLSAMESYFHGSSSGLDPLCSFLNRPFMVDGNKKVVIFDSEIFSGNDSITPFLVDTGKTGNTKPLVDWFSAEVASGKLKIDLLRDLSNECVKTFLHKDSSLFYNYLAQLSLFQLGNMRNMIPDGIAGLWESGLFSQAYMLKLCGSGGGGYVLGFTDDLDNAREIISGEKYSIIPL